MPQTPAPQRSVRPRVSGGVPWWLWAILIVIGGGVGYSLVTNSIPEDADQIFDEAIAASTKGDITTLRNKMELLRKFPDRVSQQKYLEAINLLGMSRPLKAIPLLKEISEDPSFRLRALNLLGGAYAAATDRKSAIETFELILKVDENAHEARLNIARILGDCLAWDEALPHLDFLVEQKYRLAIVLQLRADIRLDLGQFAEAALDYEQAIAEDRTDPTNGVKSTRLVQCLTETGNYEKISEFASDSDNPNVGAISSAVTHLAKNKLKEALDAMDSIRRENPYDLAMNRVYARVMVKYNMPEKAIEAVAVLRPVLKMVTRDVDLYRSVVELATAAGETELASLAQQNVDQLDVMRKEFDAKLAKAISNRDDIDDRLALADAAKNIGRIEFARKVYDGLITSWPDRESEFSPIMMTLLVPVPQLVSTGKEEPPTRTQGGAPFGGAQPAPLAPEIGSAEPTEPGKPNR